MKKNIVIPTVTLFLICLVMTALMALTNSVTAPWIAALTADSEVSAKQQVLPEAAAFSEAKQLKKDGEIYSCYEGLDGAGRAIGLVFVTTAKGYGGDIRVMTGIDLKGAVTGVQILSMNETPGLGSKAQDDGFLAQFLGKAGKLQVVKSQADGNEILAITGATISSRAVTDAVNLAIELSQAVVGAIHESPAQETGGNK